MPRNQTPGPEGCILRAKKVIELTGLSRSTLWRLQRHGKFPRSRRIGDVAVGWLDAEVRGWINGRFSNED
ncbi:MAG: AlpA family phage regulatory protein [Acidobacteriia bacterium]|nr:AlpA family phage regulatory protein [Terriglobia bacterium]